MLCRNPGKAKKGECFFIREELYTNVIRYITMGLIDKIPDGKGAKIVELSAYAPLITATAMDFIHIPLNNILVLKDEKASCRKQACIVGVEQQKKKVRDFKAFEKILNPMGYTTYKTISEDYPEYRLIGRTKRELLEHGIDINDCPIKETDFSDGKIHNKCVVKRDEKEISNILWDGMGLIDSSIFPSDMNGFIYCRSHFFKSCLFKGNIQQFFQDYYRDDYDSAYIASGVDMFGRKMKVSDIKVIVTDNSLKWLKFTDYMSESGTPQAAFKAYKKIMKNDGYTFQIVKTAHSSKYGDLQRTSFQMNNTLLTTDENILEKIASTSIDFCNNLKLDDGAFIDYLQATSTEKYSINKVMVALYNWNKDIINTEYFKKKRREMISSLKRERLLIGKLFQNGDNLTICGNPIAMLMKVTGQDFLHEGCFCTHDDRIECYTKRFAEGEMLAGFRNPHNSPNNIVCLENVYPEELIKYFPDLGKETIVINGIGTDVQDRLNSQDLDSDTIYATNQPEMAELAHKAYTEYPTIVNDIPKSTNSDYDKSMESFAVMDNKIANAQSDTGVSSNIAQLADLLTQLQNQVDENSINIIPTTLSSAWEQLKASTDDATKGVADDLQALADKGELTIDTFRDTDGAENYFDNLGYSAEEAVKYINSLSDKNSQLGAMSKNIKSITDALGTKASDGLVSVDDLSGFDATIKGLNTWEKFSTLLGDASSSMKDCQKVANELATEYVNSESVLSNLNETNRAYYESQLDNMGVTNSAAVVEAILAKNLGEEKIATEEAVKADLSLHGTKIDTTNATELFSNATAGEIIQLANEASQSGVSSQALALLAVKKLNNPTLTTDGDIKNLMDLCKGLDLATQAIKTFQSIKNSVMNPDGTFKATGTAGAQQSEALNNAFNAMKSLVKTSVGGASVNSHGSSGGGTSGGGGGGSSSTAKTAFDKLSDYASQFFDWIEVRLDRLQKKIDSNISKAESKLNDKRYSSATANYMSAMAYKNMYTGTAFSMPSVPVNNKVDNDVNISIGDIKLEGVQDSKQLANEIKDVIKNNTGGVRSMIKEDTIGSLSKGYNSQSVKRW